MPTATADNKRLNDGVVANVYTVQHQAGCGNDVKINPQAAVGRPVAHQRRAEQPRARRRHRVGRVDSAIAGRRRRLQGVVAETVAINPALAINGVEIMNQWYYRPDYMAIMANCANTQMGVWSANRLDRTVVVAVYGKGDGASQVPSCRLRPVRPAPTGSPD